MYSYTYTNIPYYTNSPYGFSVMFTGVPIQSAPNDSTPDAAPINSIPDAYPLPSEAKTPSSLQSTTEYTHTSALRTLPNKDSTTSTTSKVRSDRKWTEREITALEKLIKKGPITDENTAFIKEFRGRSLEGIRAKAKCLKNGKPRVRREEKARGIVHSNARHLWSPEEHTALQTIWAKTSKTSAPNFKLIAEQLQKTSGSSVLRTHFGIRKYIKRHIDKDPSDNL